MGFFIYKFDDYQLFDIESMDLPYPTVKNSNMASQLNQLDKLARSILLSTHNIPKQDSIPKSLKSKILKAISCDNARKLYKILEKQVIGFNVQIGTRGSRWNILHCCAKNNAHQCTEYVLKTQYQQYQDQYKTLINSKTVEGYTVIVIAIINRAHKVLQKLLEFGGVDIHILDEHKMSPYQIALNYKNDKAIRFLMNYESRTKKKQFINKEALALPLNFPKQTYCQRLTGCLLSCITFGFYDHNDGFQLKEENRIKVSDYIIEEEYIDYVAINSKKQLSGYDIQWKRASEVMTGKVTVFQSCNPFEIIQANFTIKNNLIIFQCLSQQPWLLRRNLKPDRCRNNHYNVYLYPNRMLQKQSIDDYIPYIKERKQTMFLSNQQQMWPMLLQKALAKLHTSYFSLTQIDPKVLLQQITGFPTIQIKLADIPVQQTVGFLQKIMAQNFLHVLRGKKGSELCEDKQNIQCFTTLNYYEDLILVDCPFISQKWKSKQKNEKIQLKLIKGHYNTHKQMCVWIESKKMKQFFESIIVSLSFANYERTELKMKTNQYVFFKFRIEERRQQNVYFQLSDTKTSETFDLSSLLIIKNEGKQLKQVMEGQMKVYDPKLAQIECQPGQYMCFYQTSKGVQQAQSLLLLCWAPETIQTQFVQAQLGILQWLGLLKNHFYNLKDQCVLQVLSGFSLILFRQETSSVVLLRLIVESECIIEGKKDEESGFVEMISQGNVHYCVVRRIIDQNDIAFDYKMKEEN